MPLFAADALAERAEAWMRARPVRLMISDFGHAEFTAAIARKRRSRLLAPDQAEAALENFRQWTAVTCQRIPLVSADIARAISWMRRADVNLRTPDALHLAIAERVGAELGSFDHGMLAAARRLRIPVVEP